MLYFLNQNLEIKEYFFKIKLFNFGNSISTSDAQLVTGLLMSFVFVIVIFIKNYYSKTQK